MVKGSLLISCDMSTNSTVTLEFRLSACCSLFVSVFFISATSLFSTAFFLFPHETLISPMTNRLTITPFLILLVLQQLKYNFCAFFHLLLCFPGFIVKKSRRFCPRLLYF